MTDTVNLGLPCIEGSQAQKHVTHNDALRILDTLVQLAVADRDLTAPPGSPSEGQRWIVKSAGSGAWSGHDNAIAAWQDGAWQFSAPQIGWMAFVVDEGALLIWNGTAWGDFFSAVALQNLPLVGVGTTADAANPLSAKLNNTLFVAKTVAEGGDGNLRYKMSKESAAKTLSLLFQDNFSGRAEIGLTGDDDFHFKVSPDGTTWYDAFVVDRGSGLFSKSPNRVQADTFATSGTYSVPGWAKRLKVVVTGAGAGGGSGAAGDNTANRFGGGGGAPGAIGIEEFRTADIGSSLTVTVGAGGSGGAGVTGNTNGNAGSAGGVSSVKDGSTTLVLAFGGNGGGAGTTTGGSGGATPTSMFPIVSGGASSVTAAGAAGQGTSAISAGPGGAGGGIDTASNARGGGAGVTGYYQGNSNHTGTPGTAGTSGGNGGDGGAKGWSYGRGGGGGGGAASTAANGGSGGSGGSVGAGGGGGGAARNANTSGAGGTGGAGEVWIFSYS